MSSTLIARGTAAPHSQSAYSKLTPPAATGLTLRQRLASTRGKSVPVAKPRPRGSTVGATVKYPQTAATHIPAAAILPAAAYNKTLQTLDNDITAVPVSKPWTPEYAASLLSTRGNEAAKALAEPSLEDVAEEVAFAFKRAVSDADKDRLEDQLETLRALAAVKKRRGELSPEQQQVVREIALEVESRHESAAALAEAFLKQRREVEAENIAEGRSLLKADMEAKRELAAALAAEAEAAGLERAKEDALAEAAEQEGRIYLIANEGLELASVADQLRADRSDLLKAKDALTSQVEQAKGKKRRANMKRALTRREEQLAENEAQLAAVEKQLSDAKHEFDSAVSVHSDEMKRAQSIEHRQQDALVDRMTSGAYAAATADALASFVPRDSPVRRPQTRTQTRRQQKAAEMARVVPSAEVPAEFVLSPQFEDLLEQADAALAQTPSRPIRVSRGPQESKYDPTPVQALGRPVDVIRGVADRLGVRYPKNMGRAGIYARILEADRDEAEAVRHLLYARNV